MNTDNLDFLVAETMRLNEERSYSREEEKISKFDVYPTAPGLIYQIEKSRELMAIRCQATNNIQESMQDLTPKDDSPWMYFETASLEQAEIIKDQLGNKRILHTEDRLHNINDPVTTWWMGYDDCSMTICFQAPNFSEKENWKNLGPIGDSVIMLHRFQQLQSVFRSLFPLSEYVCQKKRLSLSTVGHGHPNFTLLQRIFLEGTNPDQLLGLISDQVDRTYHLYFHELATTRRFYLQALSQCRNE